MIGTIENIITYPLTGGPGIESDFGVLGVHAGLLNDRLWVPYDDSLDPQAGPNRVSLKGPKGKLYPKLGQLAVHIDQNGSLVMCDPNYPNEVVTVPYSYALADCTVNEFGELTPGVDTGNKASDFLSEYLKHPSIRLAQKTHGWIHGSEGPAFKDRVVAPLHVIAQSSVDALSHAIEDDDYDYVRFRPSLVIGGNFEPDSEFDWSKIVIGIHNAALDIDRFTVRCIVTGIDKSGVNRNDVLPLLKASKREVKGKLEPVKGVYVSYSTDEPEIQTTIAVQQKVNVVSKIK